MESEGPYDLGDEMCVGADDSYKTLTTTLQVAIANRGFSEGRKSMEKDFNRLWEIANTMRYGGLEKDKEFDAWKKARGIE